MKILLIFALLLSMTMGRTGTINEQLRLEIRKEVLACTVGFGMSAVEESDLETVNYRDPKYRCLLSCILTRLNLLQDMKLNMENLSMICHQLFSEEKAIRKIQAYMDCIEEKKDQVFEDECDYVNKHMRCVMIKGNYV